MLFEICRTNLCGMPGNRLTSKCEYNDIPSTVRGNVSTRMTAARSLPECGPVLHPIALEVLQHVQAPYLYCPV